MKMNINIAIAVSTLLLTASLPAQAQSRKPSYYVTWQGDTVQAAILRASDKKNSHLFYFKGDRQGDVRQELRPENVKVVVYGNERFVSDSLPTAASGKQVFLKHLIESEVSLYKFTDEAGKAHFLFQKKGGELQPMQLRTYSGALKVALTGCPSFNFNDPDFIKQYSYSVRGLSRFFIAYNTCATPDVPVVEHRNKTQLYFTKGVTAGVASSAVDLDVLVAKPGNYGTYINPTIGVFGEFHVGRHLSSVLELQYHRYEGELLTQDAFYPDEIRIAMKYVRVPLLFKYTTTGKGKFFLNAGPHANYRLAQSGNRKYSSLAFNYLPDINKMAVGWSGGAGLALSPFANKSELKLEGRYNHTTLYTGVNACGTLISSQLLASISF
ncbi:porin family protein [Pontibacter mangrovi]|uniref:PorT family protein n=1 Tax=Pontibacter mangrovi TaxID=2589816 RepID=A0A501VYA4_9BACT|nr:porin family protein [Pontibacter mangrovi]TPE42389.1 PorT family protein [Pontibacter mangrovi]